MSEFTEKVVQICIAERQRFNNEVAKEWWDPQYLRIGDYWNALNIDRNGRTGIKFVRNSDGSLKLDANGQPMPQNPSKNGNPPWSAAFISFVARQANAGGNFYYSGYHSKYILKALDEAKKPVPVGPWIARRLEDYTPKVGDIIAYGREYAVLAEFDDAKSFIDKSVAPDYFPSHCDFIVEMTASHMVSIGGNLGHTVKRRKWPLKNSRIDLQSASSPIKVAICIMECTF